MGPRNTSPPGRQSQEVTDILWATVAKTGHQTRVKAPLQGLLALTRVAEGERAGEDGAWRESEQMKMAPTSLGRERG